MRQTWEGMPNQPKTAGYAQLVVARKACHLCHGLTNPNDLEASRFDSEQIGPWSLWQGNLDATLMVVGQDWGDTGYFVSNRGREKLGNPTNRALVELIGVAGISIGEPDSPVGRDVLFFTNAILCLKKGGLQGNVQPAWFVNCGQFLRRQIEVVRPTVVAGLGEWAYRAILRCFEIKCSSFRREVELAEGRLLANGSRAFAMYHCGARIQNTHRTMAVQREDWKRLRPFLPPAGSP